jgi:hypothetical protein
LREKSAKVTLAAGRGKITPQRNSRAEAKRKKETAESESRDAPPPFNFVHTDRHSQIEQKEEREEIYTTSHTHTHTQYSTTERKTPLIYTVRDEGALCCPLLQLNVYNA